MRTAMQGDRTNGKIDQRFCTANTEQFVRTGEPGDRMKGNAMSTYPDLHLYIDGQVAQDCQTIFLSSILRRRK